MRVEEFRQCVMRYEGPTLSRLSLARAVDHCVQTGHMGDSDIGPCVELARLLASFGRDVMAAEGNAEALAILHSPATSLPSNSVLEKIAPRVGWVRWQIFRCEDRPLVSYARAVEWLVQEANEEEAAWQQSHARWPRGTRKEVIGVDPDWREQHQSKVQRLIIEQAPADPVETRLTEGKGRLDGLWHVALTRREIPYKTSEEACIPVSQRDSYEYVRQTLPDIFTTFFPAGKEQIWSVPVYPGTLLATLEQEAHEIAESTGFFKLDVVAYILAGVKPVLPPVVMRVVGPEPQTPLDDMKYSCRRAVVEVLDPSSITPDLWWATYRTLRERLHIKRLRRLTEDDQRLFALVQELGGVPGHGKKGDFWERLRQRWNAEAGAEEYTTGRGLTTKYQRIIEKRNDLQQATKRDTSNSIGLPLPTEEA
jgi:hypothetical protein